MATAALRSIKIAVSEKNLDGGGQKMAGCAFNGTNAVASLDMAASVQAATAAAVSVTVANNGLFLL